MTNTPKTLTLNESDALAVRALAKCAARDTSRYAIAGVLVNGPRKFATATDGRRLVWAPLAAEGEGVALVPADVLARPKLDGLRVEGDKVTATRGRSVDTVDVVSGQFPPIDGIAQLEEGTSITVNPRLLAGLLLALAETIDEDHCGITLNVPTDPRKPMICATPNGGGGLLMPVATSNDEPHHWPRIMRERVAAALAKIGGELRPAPTAKTTEPAKPAPAPVAAPAPAPTAKPTPAPKAPKPTPKAESKPKPEPKPQAPTIPATLPEPAAALVKWGAQFNGTGFTKADALRAGVIDSAAWSAALSAAYSAKALRRVKESPDVRHTVCA